MSNTTIRNEAFRFVTLRNPQALSPQKRQENFIRYVADDTQVSLYGTLQSILNDSETSNAEKLGSMQQAATDYLKGESALTTWQKIESFMPDIATITEQLAVIGFCGGKPQSIFFA